MEGAIIGQCAFMPPVVLLPSTGLRARLCARRAQPLCSGVLDAVPEAVKLNAVAESMARSRNVRAALAATAELRTAGATLQPRTVAAIVDAITARPGPAAHAGLAQLFVDAAPRGFGRDGAIPSLALTDDAGNTASVCRDYAPDGLPDSQRGPEMGLAIAFMTLVGSALSAEVIEPVVLHHAAPEATTVLLIIAGSLAYDRFAAAGELWKRLTSGLDRLLSDDPAREARVDGAYFLVAYLLGLPFAPFRPDVRQVLSLHSSRTNSMRKRRESQSAMSPDVPVKDVTDRVTGSISDRPPLDDPGMDRYLVWLLAGPAAEAMIDGVLVESDVTSARTLLRKATGLKDENRLIKAYATARRLLTRHQVVHAKLAENMLAGLSAGECVTFLDSEFALMN